MSPLSNKAALMIAKVAITVQYIQAEEEEGMEEVIHSIEVVSLTVSCSCLFCMHTCTCDTTL